MYTAFLDFRDEICNKIICYLLRHCNLHSRTCRAFVDKVSIQELCIYVRQKR